MFEKQQQVEDTGDADRIIREELMKDDDKTIAFQEGEGFQRVEVSQSLEEAPDPRIHGAKIIFDSRMDEFSRKDDNQRLIDDLNQENYPKITLKDKKEALFGSGDSKDEFDEETSGISFKKKDAEADTGEQETQQERTRLIQQKLINFKRELASQNVPIEFIDFILTQFKNHFYKIASTERDFDSFLRFLKTHILKSKISSPPNPPKEIQKLSPSDYTIEYLLNSCKSEEAYSTAKASLPPTFISLKQPALAAIEQAVEDHLERVEKATVNEKYQIYGMHKGLKRMEEEHDRYLVQGSTGVKKGIE